jgi:hypothetical protein
VSVTNYDPKEVILIIGGHAVEGVSPGTFFSITRNSPLYTQTVGARGSAINTKMHDNTAKLKVKLMQDSISNDALSAFMVADRLKSGGILFPMALTHTSGATVAADPGIVFDTMPSLDFSDSTVDREWVFACGNLTVFIGGQSAGGLAGLVEGLL